MNTKMIFCRKIIAFCENLQGKRPFAFPVFQKLEEKVAFHRATAMIFLCDGNWHSEFKRRQTRVQLMAEAVVI
ncbi:MAG: hypothetical protein IJS97_03890 [Prevotella sp.]|nr:hypothetical protein [Prevotella sp.]